MTNIVIKELFLNDYVTREAGEKLRNLILEASYKQDEIYLDFTGLMVASTSFLDEGIAKLSEEGWNKETFSKRIKLINCHQGDRKLISKLCKLRGLC